MPTLTRADYIQLSTDLLARLQEKLPSLVFTQDDMNKAYERYVATEHKKLLTKP